MLTNLRTATPQEVANELLQPPTAAAIAARRYYDGDHWQDSAAWTGPRPPVTDTDSQAAMAEIQRAFTAQNVIAEVVDRHIAGVLGREPRWALTPRRALADDEQPSSEEQSRIDEAEAALTAWWDMREAKPLLAALGATLLLSGRAPLRLFVPPGQLINGQVPRGTLDESLARIHLHAPTLDSAAIGVDPDSQERVGSYRVTDLATGQTQVEAQHRDPASGLTVLRVQTQGEPLSTMLPLGGQLLLGEAKRRALIDPQIMQLQNLLNMALTMGGRNVVQAGFLERIITNGQMPGSWVEDASVPPDEQGRRRRFVARNLRVGPGRTAYISGLPRKDPVTGAVVDYTTPGVSYRDPVSGETFRMTKDDARAAILDSVQQRHALLSGDGAASGESRIQARADFATSLQQSATTLDALLRWLLEAALNLAAIFSGQPGRYADLRVDASCRIDTGPLTSDERRVIREEVEAGLLSTETALALLGHDDVAAELARIAAEKETKAARAQAAGLPTTPTNLPAEAQGDEPAASAPGTDTPQVAESATP